MEYQFKVGDKVKATTPTVVCQGLKDVVGVVKELFTSDRDGQNFLIRYDDVEQWAFAKEDGVVLVEDDQDQSPKVLEVGKTYRHVSGVVWTCVYVEGDNAWMKGDYDKSAAYVWSLDGESFSLGSEYDIDWGKCYG